MSRDDSTTEQQYLFDEARKDPAGQLPPKVTLLRWKLGQKAKADPKLGVDPFVPSKDRRREPIIRSRA